jgi:hypothetical protein
MTTREAPTTRTLSGSQAVTKALMEPKHRNNAAFIQNQLGEGKISQSAVSGAPSGVQRVAGQQPMRGYTKLGNGADLSKTFTPKPKLKKFVADPEYDPRSRADELSGGIFKLTRNVSLGSFLGSENSPVAFEAIPLDRRNQVIMNLYLQAEILEAARGRPEFQHYRVVVEEGIYAKEDIEPDLTENELADLSSYGRAIGYTVKSFRGVYSNQKVFELAEYLMNYPFYEKLILDYHTYLSADPVSRLFVVIPDMSKGFETVSSWKRQTETRFNGQVMSGSLMLLDRQVSDRSSFV